MPFTPFRAASTLPNSAVISVKNVVDTCDTYSQGEELRSAIVEAIGQTGKAEVSFVGVSYATSSFVNGAFAGLLEDYDLDQIKEMLSIVHSHRQINDLVRRSMTRPYKSH